MNWPTQIAALAVLALGIPAAAHANLVSDGDFSSPYGGPSFTTYSGGSTMGPWTVTGASVDLIGGYWQAPNSLAGTGSVDLDGSGVGGLSQIIPTVAGQTYTLSFDLSGNPDGLPTVKGLNVVAGSLNTNLTYTIGTNTHANMQYAAETFTFTAAGPTTLQFNSTDVGSPFGPVIGAVSVTAVPEPATLAVLGVSLAGLVLIRRQRSR